MSYQDTLNEDARLVILKALADDRDYSLNETIIDAALARFGHRGSREWIRTQLRKLEELDAVSITEAGSVLIATLTRNGLDHVEMRAVIEGVRRPSPRL